MGARTAGEEMDVKNKAGEIEMYDNIHGGEAKSTRLQRSCHASRYYADTLNEQQKLGVHSEMSLP